MSILGCQPLEKVFKNEMLQSIKQFKIIASLNKRKYNDWENKSLQLIEQGFKIEVNKWLVNCNYQNGTDLADLNLNAIKAPCIITVTGNSLIFTKSNDIY